VKSVKPLANYLENLTQYVTTNQMAIPSMMPKAINQPQSPFVLSRQEKP